MSQRYLLLGYKAGPQPKTKFAMHYRQELTGRIIPLIVGDAKLVIAAAAAAPGPVLLIDLDDVPKGQGGGSNSF